MILCDRCGHVAEQHIGGAGQCEVCTCIEFADMEQISLLQGDIADLMERRQEDQALIHRLKMEIDKWRDAYLKLQQQNLDVRRELSQRRSEQGPIPARRGRSINA